MRRMWWGRGPLHQADHLDDSNLMNKGIQQDMTNSQKAEFETLLDQLITIHARMRDHIREQTRSACGGQLWGIAAEEASDTIYSIDKTCDDLLLPALEVLARKIPFLLIAEGISEEGPLPLPCGIHPDDCKYRIIIDPIDGTRMLMYDKRSAWILTGVSPNRGEATNLADIQLAVMTEIPTTKQSLADTLWAFAGSGTQAWRENLLDGSRRKWTPTPSRAVSLDHGFAQLTKFFPGRKALAASIEEEVLRKLGAFERVNRCVVFDDQYLSTGGQIYELIAGHDRFQADLRATLRSLEDPSSPPPGMACHPYDICVELIAREAGVFITDATGNRLASPLDTTTDVDWVGYANSSLQALIAPILTEVLARYGLGKGR